jgi:GxxExxY protein
MSAAVVQADQLHAITVPIVGGAIEVHRAPGPGLLESAYEACLVFELRQRGLCSDRQKPLPIIYQDGNLDCGYRLNLAVADCISVELKAGEKLNSVHDAWLISHLERARSQVGSRLNFHCTMLEHGIRRLVNDFPSSAISAAK